MFWGRESDLDSGSPLPPRFKSRPTPAACSPRSFFSHRLRLYSRILRRTAMRSPEPPYSSFTQVMLAAYPALAPLLSPPSRSSQETRVNTDTWSFNSEEDMRRSLDDVFMVSWHVASTVEPCK
jgi:hypothetical protein